ncbi:MAG: cyclic nucleotide-binding domain-containing protein [Smithella sp.]
MIKKTEPGLKRLDLAEKYIAELLDETQWSKDFTWNQIFNLSGYFKAYRATKGAEIFCEGQSEHSLGIIISGEIDIIKYGLQQKATVLARLRAGQTFGEMTLLDDEPRSATAMAASDVTYLFLSLDEFIRLSKEKAPLGFALLWKISRQLSQRLRKTSGQLVEHLGGAMPED